MSKKSCLCKNGTYHVDCCDGTLRAQGNGRETNQSTTTFTPIEKSFNKGFSKGFAV